MYVYIMFLKKDVQIASFLERNRRIPLGIQNCINTNSLKSASVYVHKKVHSTAAWFKKKLT